MGIPKKLFKCKHCGQELPENRKYFVWFKEKDENGNWHRPICRECEDKIEKETEWHDGKLLCHICNQYLPVEDFNMAGGNKYVIRQGRDKRCYKCKREQNKQARTNYSDEKRLIKTLQARWLGARDRAKRKGIPFTISKEDLLNIWNSQNGLCKISKIPMTYELDEGRIYTNVSIDQIEPGKGYTVDNIQLVCSAVNQLKSNWNMDTVLYICKSIIENYK